jgi:4-hydroxy-tetrahydrodipicolinate reductase
MKLLVIGYQGVMGQVVLKHCADAPDLDVYGLGIARTDKVFLRIEDAPLPDVILDFSVASALSSYLDYALTHAIPCVIATTGHTPQQEAEIQHAATRIPVFKSANFSLGIFVLHRLVAQATALLGGMDVDVYDVHHTLKRDAPSGTAKALIETIVEARPLAVRNESHEARQADTLYVHVERRGSVVGEHRVIFSDASETLELKHSAASKDVFAKGALQAVRWIVGQSAGYYAMEDLWKHI